MVLSDVSPNDPRNVKEIVLPKLPKEINDKINSFRQMYGVRKIDWVQYLVHEMHLNRFMRSLRNIKNKKMCEMVKQKNKNERKQSEDMDDNDGEQKSEKNEEQKYHNEELDVDEFVDNLNDENIEAMKALDAYIIKNENNYEDILESEECDIFKPSNDCEHSEIDSEPELSEPEKVKRFDRFDDSEDDDEERELGIQ